MINRNMKRYELYECAVDNEYKQYSVKNREYVDDVKMAIYLTSQSIQDNINYKNATYVGFTHYDADYLTDRMLIRYDRQTYLKILYINPQGRLNQVFMSEV